MKGDDSFSEDQDEVPSKSLSDDNEEEEEDQSFDENL